MVSSNIGLVLLKNMDYTVIGDSVNTAQRLQSVAKPNQVLVNEQVYQQANASFTIQKIGDVTLKNKALPVIVYETLA